VKLSKLKRIVLLVALAGVTAAAVAPASGDEVTVAVSNPGGSRTVYVENLLGQTLTSLDFGTTRSQPVRVRVVDTTMDRSGFQVLTTMSHLYKVSGQSYDWASTIASSDISVNYPPDPLNLLDVHAVVAPVYDMTETVSGALCTAIQAQGGSCNIVMSGIEGLRQTVDLVVDLTDLSNLPLIPQIGETGDYTQPDYSGIGANDPNKPGSFTPTSREVISGAVSNAVNTLNSITTALQSLVAGLPTASIVDADTVTGALRDALGGPVYDALLPTEVQTIVDSLNATVRAVTSGDVIGQTGTYLSYPKLDVNVPATTSAGDYEGTLVVTAVQL
jgi:hypothetical protein